MSRKEFKYDVVLSYANEDRTLVEKVAECLKNKKIKLFYDKYEKVDLWGKELYSHLDDIYQNKAKYCIIFISKWYAQKNWTNHERISAQARAFAESSEDYILPIRLDNTRIPGLRPTIGYIDGLEYTPKQLCDLIIKKLGIFNIRVDDVENYETEKIKVPKIKRKITDLEKRHYVKNSFDEIRDYFKNALIQLKKINPHLETELDEITPSKFVAAVYVERDLKVQCKIWIGGLSNYSNGISYLESTRGIDINNDNSLNDNAAIDDDGIDIFFNVLGMSFGPIEGLGDINLKRATAKDVARFYWGRFINYLRY